MTADLADYPWAAQVVDGILVYSTPALRPAMVDPATRATLESEIVRALDTGPGVVVFSDAFDDPSVLEAVTAAFDDLVVDARQAPGDDVAAVERVDGALDALGVDEAAAGYRTNDVVALVANAWLGPGYRMDATVEVANPGAPAAGPVGVLPGVPSRILDRLPDHTRGIAQYLALRAVVAHTELQADLGELTCVLGSRPAGERGVGAVALDGPGWSSVPLFPGDVAFINPAVTCALGANASRLGRRMVLWLELTSVLAAAIGQPG